MNLDLETILMFITTVFNFFLGSVIFIHGDRKKSDISYIILILMLVFWTLSVLGIRLANTYESSIFYLAISHVFGLGISISFWYFVEIFVGRRVPLSRVLYIVSPAIIISLLAFMSTRFIVSIDNIYSLNKDLVLGPYHLLFVAYFSALMTYAFYRLYGEYKNPKNSVSSSAVVSVFVGTFISTSVGATFNIYYLLVGVSDYIAWGPISMIIMVVFIAYAIVRHNLMNIKIIASEIFVIILLLTLSVRLTLSNTPVEWIINSVSLFVSICVGIFLIRSVYKEVRQREEIEKLANGLKEANQGQASLMHFMNHQIKGRLGNIKDVFAELIAGSFGVMPEESVEILKKGLEEADTGVNYVQGILKGASAESGTLPLEMKEMDFRELVNQVVEKQKEYAVKKGLVYNFKSESGDYKIKGDAVQLGEAVRNLIDNSINYTLKGSIDIVLSQNNRIVTFKIKDTGVGLSAEDKLKLFKAGGRGFDSLKVNVNATGFGLVFVKGLVESHHGKVWAESEGCGHGSTFYLELPKLIK